MLALAASPCVRDIFPLDLRLNPGIAVCVPPGGSRAASGLGGDASDPEAQVSCRHAAVSDGAPEAPEGDALTWRPLHPSWNLSSRCALLYRRFTRHFLFVMR